MDEDIRLILSLSAADFRQLRHEIMKEEYISKSWNDEAVDDLIQLTHYSVPSG